MSILVNGDTRVLVQGITGKAGRAQTRWMLNFGTRIVAGVTPGRGSDEVEGVPVYNCVADAVAKHEIDASVLFVPPAVLKDAAIQAIDSGIKLIVIVTEHTPVHDVMMLKAHAAGKESCLLGPTSPGVVTPGQAKLGIMPGSVFTPGRIGVISRSGTLSYEISVDLTAGGLGQSTVVGIGGDMVPLTGMADLLEMFQNDPDTDAVIIVGEVGGIQEEKAAEFISQRMTKPVIAYIAGRNSPEGKRMGHAGAIVQGDMGTPQSKVKAFRQAGVPVADYPLEIVELVKKRL